MKLLAKAALAAIGIWALAAVVVWVDLGLRAREAYAEGLKYIEWDKHPEIKAAYYDAELSSRQARLDREFQAGRVAPDAYKAKMSLLRFERDERISESSLKYAYVWFQTGCDLLSPPQSRWVRLCCGRMPTTLKRWKTELKVQGVPFEDYMFE